jgi:DNA repair protein RecO (recombination protein O)
MRSVSTSSGSAASERSTRSEASANDTHVVTLGAVPGLYRDQGVVLRTIKLGEADRIVTLLTQAHGKVRAVAKGIRRPGSRFGARLEPTSHVAFQCYRGRELDVVTQVETIDSNQHLRDRYVTLTHAISMLEATDQVAQERERNTALYRMLVGALRTLAADPSPMVSTAFFWKLLSLEGFHPMLDSCARCGADQPFVAFDLAEGGVLCASCGRHGGRRVTSEALDVVGRVVGGELNGVLASPPPQQLLHEIERLAIAALEHQSERRLRSAALL